MKLIFGFLALIVCMGVGPRSEAQLLEMAADCDQAVKKLTEIIKTEKGKSGQQIRESLGVDSLMECDAPEGKFTCFQCLDDKKELKLIQILQRLPEGQYEILGAGCRCSRPR